MTWERDNGPFPEGSGIAYADVYFFDALHVPTDKEHAVHFEMHMFDEEGNVIARNYA